jgi:hypothetical protein
MLSVTVGLEAVPIGWQRFILGSSQSDCTAFLLFLVTKATRLLAQAPRMSSSGNKETGEHPGSLQGHA